MPRGLETRTPLTSHHMLVPTCPLPPGGPQPRPGRAVEGGEAGGGPGVCREEGGAPTHRDKRKPRRGPLNEDVFSAQPHVEEKALQRGTQELTEQIHRLLLQVGGLPARPPSCPRRQPRAALRPGGPPHPPFSGPSPPSSSALRPAAHGGGLCPTRVGLARVGAAPASHVQGICV